MKKLLLLCAVATLVLPSVGCRGGLLERIRNRFRGAQCTTCMSPTVSESVPRQSFTLPTQSYSPAAIPVQGSCATGTCGSAPIYGNINNSPVVSGYPSDGIIQGPIYGGDAPRTDVLPPPPGPVIN